MNCTCVHGNREADADEHDASCPYHGIDVVWPDKDPKADPGWRLHFFRLPYENATFAEEQVLPEKVADPRAHRVISTKQITLKQEEIRWLRDQLDETLRRLNLEGYEHTEREKIVDPGTPPTHRLVAYTTVTGWNSEIPAHTMSVTCELCGETLELFVGKHLSTSSHATNWMVNHRASHP